VEAFLQWLTANWWVLFVFILCFGGGTWAGVKYLFQQWQDGRRREYETELKRDMVAKGFAPADIERVLLASALPPEPGPEKRDGPGFDKARLVASLTEQGMDAKGIERVLHALGEFPDEELPAKVSAVHSMLEQGMDAEGIERVIRAFHRPTAPTSVPEPAEETSIRG